MRPVQIEAPRIRAVHFMTLGSLAPTLARELVARVSTRLLVACRLIRPDEDLTIPYLHERSQVNADLLLAKLEERVISPGVNLVGLIAKDLGNPIFTFFFGRARLNGRAALVSVARLDAAFYGLPRDLELMLDRATSEVLHELGHNAGLHHCNRPDCLMRVAATVEAIDNRGTRWCPSCASALPAGLFRP